MTDKEAMEQTQEFLSKESVTEFDAIHPRFMEPQDEAEIHEYEVRNHFWCDYCKLFFAPSVRGLKTHFSGDMVDHPSCGSCFYCQGKVFEYKINNQVLHYHNCKDCKKDDEDKDS